MARPGQTGRQAGRCASEWPWSGAVNSISDATVTREMKQIVVCSIIFLPGLRSYVIVVYWMINEGKQRLVVVVC